ncbi:MAG: hypothetical protein LUD29_05595 [Clostridia bacterium]|nr:hypothetical protein [Clostridia bacterium]
MEENDERKDEKNALSEEYREEISEGGAINVAEEIPAEEPAATPKPVPKNLQRRAAFICLAIEIVALALVVVGLVMELRSAASDGEILTGFIILLFGVFIAIIDVIWFFTFTSRANKIKKNAESAAPDKNSGDKKDGEG